MELYTAFLHDLLKEHSNQNYDLYVYISPVEKAKQFEKEFEAPHYAIQTGANLGNKIFNSIKELLGLYKKVVMVPSDVPTLKEKTISDSFFHLDQADVVLGPASDGAFYLIGMKEPHDILTEATWGDNKTLLKEVLQIASKQKVSVFLMKEIVHDVDTIEDLQKLKPEIHSRPDSETAKLLKKLKI